MRSVRSAQRQVELGRLGNQLPVLGKANSFCEVSNTSLHFDRAMYLLVILFCFKMRLGPGAA